jgi:MFS family permease
MVQPLRIPFQPAGTLYHGWRVVAAGFLVAMFGFGLGFYGPGVYLVALTARHGWSTAELSPAITVYYVLGATLLFFWVGSLFDRLGARLVVAAGAVALACGVGLLPWVDRLWQVYAAFAVMSLGWATMSGAAVAIIVAPWFDRRRGLAISWALNGASAGGMVGPPLLTVLFTRFGFAASLDAVAGAMLAVLLPVVLLVLRRRHADEHDRADRPAVSEVSVTSSVPGPRWHLATVLRSWGFVTISVPFALAMMAQVGFLTHQLAFLAPHLGVVAAGWAISLTSLAAVLGRIGAGCVVDRLDRRVVACANFLLQIAGMAVLATATTPAALYLGCVLFGLAVGNITLLPGLIVQREFPQEHFARAVSLVVAVNQFSFAFGPSLLGVVEKASGGYALALLLCLAMQALAAAVVMLPLARKGARAATYRGPD